MFPLSTTDLAVVREELLSELLTARIKKPEPDTREEIQLRLIF